MQSLETELERARDLDVAELADAVEAIGFECTRCGACCKSEADDPHTATVFPDEVRRLQEAAVAGASDDGAGSDGDDTDGEARDDGDIDGDDGDARDWRDVARPMPYGLTEGDDGPEGETFEWALQTDSCGDCVFYEEREASEASPGDDEAVGAGACRVHADRPLICETYPFSVGLGGTSQPMGEVVDTVALGGKREHDGTDDAGGVVRAHECEGLGRDIDRADAESLASALKERAVRELEEAIGVRDAYEPTSPGQGEVVVHDSEGAKRPDGSRVDEEGDR
ncbi:YkgJ family cysteine cluster protein [Halobaculum sp. WSA2]|uniref:YkgJ family cysteine cluster protein n=1 Tax=Halobaculum saliterrae TaxID=2073113 RepID=A0A6B0SYB4_9EURY|nr:YkgJ family cysteine cluster protein [Halobaculum saliterrae]MXR41312.1 YkgJ family cysteine cluster protein [Halobaculum saliterrae]